MKYEATVYRRTPFDLQEKEYAHFVSDTLESALKCFMRMFSDVSNIDVRAGCWYLRQTESLYDADTDKVKDSEVDYYVEVKRIDPVLPSELKRELEKLGC